MKVAIDLVIRRGQEFLFIRRMNEPFKGMLALPGGFVEDDETVEHAAVRELEEETAIRVSEDALQLVGVFSRVDRDPRQRVISIAFCIEMTKLAKAQAGSDAADTLWLPKDKALELGLAFDHAEILRTALDRRRAPNQNSSAIKTN
jgi:8-oxo-dGTP diphosphatase